MTAIHAEAINSHWGNVRGWVTNVGSAAGELIEATDDLNAGLAFIAILELREAIQEIGDYLSAIKGIQDVDTVGKLREKLGAAGHE